MQMTDGLSAVRTGVRDQSEAALVYAAGARDGRRDLGEDVPREFLVRAGQRHDAADMFLWDDEDMRRRLRFEVAKREHALVLVDFP